MTTLLETTREILDQEQTLRQGGGASGQERQRRLGRLTARERVAGLFDSGSPFRELGVWAAWGMYAEWGNIPAAGVIAGIGRVHGRSVMVVANDATVKAGAFFPQTVKKVLRAQRIAMSFRLPLIRRESSCHCRMRSSRTKTTSVASFATTPCCRRWEFHSTRP
jgi:3-methylcrotonyl-CoA carboxylase beta subunit